MMTRTFFAEYVLGTWYKTEDEYIKPSYDDEFLEPYHPTYLPEE